MRANRLLTMFEGFEHMEPGSYVVDPTGAPTWQSLKLVLRAADQAAEQGNKRLAEQLIRTAYKKFDESPRLK